MKCQGTAVQDPRIDTEINVRQRGAQLQSMETKQTFPALRNSPNWTTRSYEGHHPQSELWLSNLVFTGHNKYLSFYWWDFGGIKKCLQFCQEAVWNQLQSERWSPNLYNGRLIVLLVFLKHETLSHPYRLWMGAQILCTLLSEISDSSKIWLHLITSFSSEEKNPCISFLIFVS